MKTSINCPLKKSSSLLHLPKYCVMRLLTVFFLLVPLISNAQNKHYDRLEMLYDQGHYKKVLRISTRMLNKKEHQTSLLPNYYKELAQLQLFRNEDWRNKNPNALEQSAKIFVELKASDKDGRVFKAHAYEIQSLKRDYDLFLEELEQNKVINARLIDEVRKAYSLLFSKIDDIKDSNDKVKSPPLISDISDLRRKIVAFAYKYQGTKYRSGGSDSNGFDCSGFVSFVFNEFKIELPRISRDQQKLSTPLKVLDLQAGDLIFFASGSGVNHVGIVVENKNGFITMIHSSTSQGIVVTDIDNSNYWKSRIHSYGTFLKD